MGFLHQQAVQTFADIGRMIVGDQADANYRVDGQFIKMRRGYGATRAGGNRLCIGHAMLIHHGLHDACRPPPLVDRLCSPEIIYAISTIYYPMHYFSLL